MDRLERARDLFEQAVEKATVDRPRGWLLENHWAWCNKVVSGGALLFQLPNSIDFGTWDDTWRFVFGKTTCM